MGALGVTALVIVSLAAVAGLLVLRQGAIRAEGARGTLLRHMAVAGIAAALSAVMYLADYGGSSRITLAIANGAMVCSPALIWVALTRVNGRAPAAVLVAIGLSAVTGLVAPFADTVVSGAVKVAALLLACALGGIETFSPPVSTLRGARIVRHVMLGYAAFCALRLSAAAILGYGAAFFPWGMVTQITTALGILCILAVGVGSWRMAAALDVGARPQPGAARVREWARARLDEGSAVTTCVLSLPDLALIRAAHGAARAESVEDALWRAAGETAPADCPVARIGRGRFLATMRTAQAQPSLVAALQRRFDDLTPLVAYEDLPEIRIEQLEIHDLATVDALLGRRHGSRLLGRIRVAHA
ncbi:hypothetical protein [Microbacterium sp. SORGH_AS_0888]|uniref:hypothetical protein n=1 Tax=Microbacterium sp. SORGH_AS_0888 TaxID=3041791 RepID=UPI0027883965|nr:hypothetical protein [Microbacterium sp. SORGH_AS_0888]MDQ1129329.1 hypothetical protein [Microbacterium sp. SORGH_AS_0888]